MNRQFKMDHRLTYITRGVIFFVGFAVFSICAILLPEIAREEAIEGPGKAQMVYPFLIGAWAISVPIFIALHQCLKLISYIEEGNAFSHLSVKILQNIKRCALAFSAMIILGAIVIIALARNADPREDVTHIITLGFIFTFISSVVATFAAVVQKLLGDAIDIKSENDLIV